MNKKKVTLIPGDGIGREIVDSVVEIFKAADTGIIWCLHDAGEKAYNRCGELLPEITLDSIKQNGIALKGPLTTPVGKGFRSVNVQLRKELNLYANIRPIKTIEGVKTPYSDRKIDMVIVRENTEGLYSGVEHMVGDDAAETIKIITRNATENIIGKAYWIAISERRSKVTIAHKANIQKLTDGLFLKIAREVYDNSEACDFEFDEKIIDNMCMQLVVRPEEYDVIVAPNFYGDILSDLCAGLVGGLGVAPGANIGDTCAVYEAVHGTAPDIAGKNLANPTSLLLSACMMLRDHRIADNYNADRIEAAVLKTIKEGKVVTGDLGGSATTTEFTEEIIKNL